MNKKTGIKTINGKAADLGHLISKFDLLPLSQSLMIILKTYSFYLMSSTFHYFQLRLKIYLLTCLFIFISLFTSCLPEESKVVGQSYDWPQWRGPARDGIWKTDIQLGRLTAKNIKKLWEAPIGPGYSGPTMAKGLVYVTDYLHENPSQERILCFDAENGKSVWTYSYPCAYYQVGYGTGPRASVLIHEGKAYTLGTMGDLTCLDARNGDLIWHHDGLQEFKARIPTWGLAASPIMVENLLIVQMGGQPNACIMAFDKDSGKEVWRVLDDEASYAAPILIEQAGKTVLVCWTADHVVGLNPASGEIYWQIPFTPKKMIINVASPVYSAPYLFLTSFFDGSMLLKLDPDKTNAEVVWTRAGRSERKTDALHSTIGTPVIDGNYIYGVDSYGEVRCLEILTGNRLWVDTTLTPQARWSTIHFVQQAEKVWGFNEKGELILGKFSDQAFQEFGRVPLIDPVPVSPNPRGGVCWAHPAFAGDNIFVRNDEKLICFQVVE